MNSITDNNGRKINVALLVATLIVGVFTTVLNQTILSTAFPTLMKAFSISTATVQWLTTGFMMVNGIMIPVTAYLTSKVPTQRLYLIAMSTFLLGTIVAFTAPSFAFLLAGRLIQAVGVGITMPLLQNIMLTIFPPNKRGAAMGVAGIAIGVAPAIGPTLSGFVIDNFGWRTLFGMLIPITIAVIIAAFFFMRDVLPQRNPHLDVLSLIESTIGFGALLYGFSEVGDKGWGSPFVYGSILVGILVIALFAYRQLHMDVPFLELRVFKSHIFTLSTVLASIANMAMVGAEMVIPLYLQIIHGKSALESGLTLLPGALMMAVMSQLPGPSLTVSGLSASPDGAVHAGRCYRPVRLRDRDHTIHLHHGTLRRPDVWDLHDDDATDHQRDERTEPGPSWARDRREQHTPANC